MPDDGNDLFHLRIITQKELRTLVPYTDQHIRRLEKAGRFPRRMQLGQNRIGWRLMDIKAWIKSRMPAQIYAADPEQPDPI
jgi:prophage regulatory protein